MMFITNFSFKRLQNYSFFGEYPKENAKKCSFGGVTQKKSAKVLYI